MQLTGAVRATYGKLFKGASRAVRGQGVQPQHMTPGGPSPLEVLYARAASVGIFEMSRMQALVCCAGSCTSEVDE